MSITAQQILESIPYRFREEKSTDLSGLFHFDISGDETLQYTVELEAGKCTLTSGFVGSPTCVLKTTASVYVELETGKANPQMALMMGKVKVSNLAAMLQFAKCFKKFDATVAYQTEATSTPSVALNFKQRAPKSGPLAGIKIIDFTRLLPGPLATMFLADMGADVIKIEDPDNPDYIRDFEPRINGMSLFYLSLNRSKRSLAINYLSAEGKQVIYDLVKSADVLIEQYRPGVMAELGLGYEQLKAINPKLIYVSVIGYGQQSSMAMAAGHDLNYIAIAGALGITAHAKTNEPIIPGFQLADIAGGSYMAMNAITTALFQRERTSKGAWVDVSMTDAALPFNVLQFASFQGTKIGVPRGQFELSGQLANYNVYACADGKYVALGSLEPKFWNKFCAKVNRLDWAERFLQQGEDLAQLKREVRVLFLTKTRNEWVAYFSEDDICLTAVNELDEIENDALLKERDMFVDSEHPAVGKYKTINQPLKFVGETMQQWDAPDLGEDSASILRELHYDDFRIIELLKK